MKIFIALSLICLLTVATFAAGPVPAPERTLFDLLNQERRKAGLNPLMWNDQLAQAALLHSQLLASHKSLSHRFRGEPELPARASAAGARFSSVGENVAFAPTVPRAHDGLMHSPPHRANILSPEFTSVGIAIVARGDELYITQDFSRTLPSYTAQNFEQGVIASFKRARRSNALAGVDANIDPALEQAACQAKLDPKSVLNRIPDASSVAVFTASRPDDLPPTMQQTAADPKVRRMSIGACLQPADSKGFAKYWVVAAFYRAKK
jgi:cysteine-rich secretory family protein